MTKSRNTRRLLQLMMILIGQCTVAFAQKLPKVQASSVWAPANIKIDGKLTEWNEQFQAHNNGNHMYYTLSNDSKDLYLTVRMEDVQGDAKIFRGGITFTVIPLDKETEKMAVTFPVIHWPEQRADINDAGGNHLTLYKELRADTVANKTQIESLIARSNKEISDDYKDIYIKGVTGISDPLISIYNTEGIIAAAGFDKKMLYTYELAIPLKYLGSAISNTKSIKYNIKLNIQPVVERKNKVQHSTSGIKFSQTPSLGSIDEMFNYNDSDFSGEYTLALKP